MADMPRMDYLWDAQKDYPINKSYEANDGPQGTPHSTCL